MLTPTSDEISKTAGLFFNQAGHAPAFAYLFGFIRQLFSIDCLICFVHDINQQVMWPITSLELTPNEEPEVLTRMKDLPQNLFSCMNVDYLMQVHIVNDRNQAPLELPIAQKYYMKFSSTAHIPLFQKHGKIYSIHLLANKINIFHEEGIKKILEWCTCLIVEMQNSLAKNWYEFQEQLPQYMSLLWRCSDLVEVIKKIEKVATKPTQVLLTGETGVGKGVVARAIHHMDKQSELPFISVNCGGLQESLAESLLFGHERGSFTGAQREHKGFFEQAQNGTLFLDEIGELPLILQAHLLHFFDTHTITRVGASKNIPLNIRIIAATNRNLEKMVSEGTFRQDLYYRLQIYPIHIPPLRHRTNDIPVLTSYYISEICQIMGIRPIPTISNSIIHKLQNYLFPGNVRELKHLIEKSLIDHDKGNILNINLPTENAQLQISNYSNLIEEPNTKLFSPSLPSKEKIINTLLQSKGKISGKNGAASILEVHRVTLHRYLTYYNINPKDFRNKSRLL